MALGKNRTRQNVRGGGTLKAREIYPTQTDVFVELGHLGGTDVADEHNMIELTDEAGNLIDAMSGARKVMMNTILKQTSKEEIDLVKNADGKYYDFYYPVKLANGTYQELSIAVGKIKPGPTLKFASATERTIAVQIYALAPKASAVRAPVNYNVAANEPYVLIENAALVGPPTETVATFATVIAAIL